MLKEANGLKPPLKNQWAIIGPDEQTQRYFAEKKLGFISGRNSLFYKACDVLSEKSVAVKMLPKNHTEKNEKDFEEEVNRLRAVDGKPGCPKFIDFFIAQQTPQGETPVLIMEYIEAESLNDRYNNQTLTKDEFIKTILQTAEVVDDLSQNNNFHVDLKSEHIKMTQPFITLVDFGDDFTMGLCAPERIKGETNETTDEFALAALVNYILTGKKVRILGNDPKTVKAVFSEFTYWDLKYEFDRSDIVRLNKIFNKALANSPEERYKSATEFANEFAEVMKNSSGPNKSLLHILKEALSFD